jgi:hypothetical protein
MDRRVRRAIERVFADRISVGKATKPEAIQALLERLKPVPMRVELKRFGAAGDGGYLMPDDLEGVSACISPGVASECGFDLEVASRGIDVLMADASVSGAPVHHPRFHFTPKFLDIWSSDKTMTIEEMCAPAGESDLLLQMDIEGAEYRVLAAMPEQLLRRFRIIVIEFHELDAIFSQFAFRLLQPVFEKLTKFHSVVHIHPNNSIEPTRRYSLTIPPVMEFTFYRNDRFQVDPDRVLHFPHVLDVACVPAKPPVELPQCWR